MGVCFNMTEALIADPALEEPYDKVRKDPNTKYFVFGYADKNKLRVDAVGGDIAEGVSKLSDTELQYAYFKVNYQNVDGVNRERFVFVSWIGPNVKGILVKSRPSTHLNVVKQVVKDTSVTLKSPDRDVLTEEAFIEEAKRVNF